MLGILLSLMAGVGLSFFYFGGLWWTVRRVARVRHPKRLLLGSFVGRTVGVLGGFYLIIVAMGDRWELLAGALVGFLIGRTVLVQRWGPRPAAPQPTS